MVKISKNETACDENVFYSHSVWFPLELGSEKRQVLPGPLEIFSASPFSFRYRSAVLIGFVLGSR